MLRCNSAGKQHAVTQPPRPAIEPANGRLRPTRMAKFVGQLLFELLWDFVERQMIRHLDQKAGPWLNAKLSKRAALAVGLLLGLAAWGIWPLLAWLLAN